MYASHVFDTDEPLLTATSLQRPLHFVPADSPYIDSYFRASDFLRGRGAAKFNSTKSREIHKNMKNTAKIR